MIYDQMQDTSDIIHGATDYEAGRPPRLGYYYYLYGYFLFDARNIFVGTDTRYPAFICSLSIPESVPDDVRLNIDTYDVY